MHIHIYLPIYSGLRAAGPVRSKNSAAAERVRVGCLRALPSTALGRCSNGANGKARTHQCSSILPASPPQHAMIKAATVGCQLWQFGSSALATASSSAVALPAMTSATLDRKRRRSRLLNRRNTGAGGRLARCCGAHLCLLALVASARSASRNATIAARAWAGVRAAATCSAVFLQPSAVRRCRRVWSSGTLQGLYARYGLSAGTTRGVLEGYSRGTLGVL